jgi:branched-chain amino acid transport system permease protein
MLGAIVGVFFSMLLPGISKAWQLYLGLFFIAVVMVAPGGIAGILVSYWRAIEERRWRTLWRLWLAQAAAMLVLLTGVVLLVEMLYRLALDAADGVPIQLAGFGFSPAQAGSWLLAGVLLAAGLVGWRRAGRSLAEADSGPEPEVRQ